MTNQSFARSFVVNNTLFIQAVIGITENQTIYSPLFETLQEVIEWKEKTFAPRFDNWGGEEDSPCPKKTE